MRRYIDADKLRAEFNCDSGKYCATWEFIDKPSDIQFLIDEQPTADVFEKDLLTDRPCAVCKYNTAKKGCTQWDCVFGI